MKKILGLTIAALLVMALVGGGTWAYFSDPEYSTGNILSAGTLDLTLKGGNADVQVLTTNVSNVAPGSGETDTAVLANVGTLAGELDIVFGTVANLPGLSNASLLTPVSGESIGTGDGATLPFGPVVNANGNGTNYFADVSGDGTIDSYDVTVYVAAASQTNDGTVYTINAATGIVTFAVAPSGAITIDYSYAAGEFIDASGDLGGQTNMAVYLDLTGNGWDSGDIGLDPAGSDTYYSFATDWATDGKYATIDTWSTKSYSTGTGVTTLDPSESNTFTIDWTIPAAATTNAVQGDSTSLGITFTLEQAIADS